MATNWVSVDYRVDERAGLLPSLGAGSEWRLVGADEDGLQQVRWALEGRRKVASIRIATHGRPDVGELRTSGGADADWLDGGTPADSTTGGDGADPYAVDRVSHRLIQTSAAANFTDNGLADTLRVCAGGNVLDGGAGGAAASWIRGITGTGSNPHNLAYGHSHL
ncbi:DUF4347 domain-containing protein [Accumulibacter sp.]|uniref:DUF4347 domain-containing protein n=1 Tax=Accumulibacter sp. TaxID=2053492 RepID=UPI0025D6E28D|nr:DUF4347 domain-containing protein [Accumulibacter sp.]MCM8614291.1 DUF4347 domain-containing protein [Accumulibacter sp.]MCM8634567.1 DUF4347 domain-containing protein [Accumulibacter sp.]MCM8641758.1 DUF4347 domain-containing protein [Accumulibacter sp.]